MNAPIATINDALPEIVSRARKLLDKGDFAAAQILAEKAYADAKQAAQLGERVGASKQLIEKAHRLQADALLIESLAKIQLAEFWDAQKAAGKTHKGRPKSVPDGNAFSAADAGISRKEIHEARKLRDAEAKTPGIIQRAIDARLETGLEPTKANLRAAVGTASATNEERGNNLYQTPAEALYTLLALEAFKADILEPACGKGAISSFLENSGYRVLLSDLVDYKTVNKDGAAQKVCDFLRLRRGNQKRCGIAYRKVSGNPDIATNPPYGQVLNAFIAHALREFRPGKMALLLNLNFLAGFEDPDRTFALEEWKPARVHVFKRRLPMMHRDGWDGEEADSRMNTAWFIWERVGGANAANPYPGPTIINRVDWKDHVPEGWEVSGA
ncbi:SAM-dependent methyltransferase [Pararhizobium sp.]|uniref:SAM-dependent methyltransferase n=1 Tax=Pararhizobium sp. TaxID=1977563 RepID=UPI003D0EBDD1